MMNRIQTVAKLYDMRDAAKLVLGVNYAALMSDLGDAIKINAADRRDKDVLLAAMDICTTKYLQGMDLTLMMVAAVELIEPSGPDREDAA